MRRTALSQPLPARRPATPAAPLDPALHARVAAVLEEIRPAVQADGGDVELDGVDPATGVVRVRFAGACVDCPSSSLTLNLGIEQHLKSKLPEVTAVRAVD